MEIELKINKESLKDLHNFLIIFVFVFFSLFIFFKNFFTVQNYPIIFGDEGYHMRIAKDFAKKREFFHYLDFFEPNKPSYSYLSIFHFLKASGFLISESFARSLLPLTIFLIAFSMFVVFWKIFDRLVALISSILFQLFQSTVIYSVTFYVDSLLVLFSFLSFGFIFLFEKYKEKRYILLSSIFLTLSLLTKHLIPIPISFSVLLLLFYYYLSKKIDLRNFLMFLIFPLIAVVLVILLNVFIYRKICVSFWLLSDFLNNYLEGSCEIETIKYKNIYNFEGRTERVGSEVDLFSFGLVEYINFAYGPSTFIIFFFFIGVIYLLFFKKIDFLFPLISVILLTIGWLIIFYPLTNNLGVMYRVEDMARYLYFFNPFVAFYVSIFVYAFREFLDSILYKNKQIKKILYFFLILLALVFVIYKFTISYLQKLEIMRILKTFSPYFFDACEWVKNNLEKNVTLMSLWSYRVLYSCERNVGGVGDLRLSDNSTFINELAKKIGIEYFFVEKFSIDPLNRNLEERYNLKWVELLVNSSEKFEIVYENGVPFEKCKKEYLLRGYQCDGIIIFRVK